MLFGHQVQTHGHVGVLVRNGWGKSAFAKREHACRTISLCAAVLVLSLIPFSRILTNELRCLQQLESWAVFLFRLYVVFCSGQCDYRENALTVGWLVRKEKFVVDAMIKFRRHNFHDWIQESGFSFNLDDGFYLERWPNVPPNKQKDSNEK